MWILSLLIPLYVALRVKYLVVYNTVSIFINFLHI